MRVLPLLIALVAALGTPGGILADDPAVGPLFSPITQPMAPSVTFFGVMGEIGRPGVYLGPAELTIAELIQRAGGVSLDADGTIRLVRGGRVAQQVLLQNGGSLPLFTGDLVVVGRRSTARQASANPGAADSKRTAIGASPTQIAFVNLIDRPVVVKVRAGNATVARIIKLLGQSAELADKIRVIGPPGSGVHLGAADTSVESTLESGAVLVFPPRSIRAELLPALPQPIVPTPFDAPSESTNDQKNEAPSSAMGLRLSALVNRPPIEAAPPPPPEPSESSTSARRSLNPSAAERCSEPSGPRMTAELPTFSSIDDAAQTNRDPQFDFRTAEVDAGPFPRESAHQQIVWRPHRRQAGPMIAVMWAMAIVAALAIVFTLVPIASRWIAADFVSTSSGGKAAARPWVRVAFLAIARSLPRRASRSVVGSPSESSPIGPPPLPAGVSGWGRPVRIDAHQPFTRLGIDLAAIERSSLS